MARPFCPNQIEFLYVIDKRSFRSSYVLPPEQRLRSRVSMALFSADLLSHSWQERLQAVVETMQEMSRQTDPEAMVRAYGRRMDTLFPASRRLSLSRRGHVSPEFRVTRYSGWTRSINPWKQVDQLPLLQGGLLSELIYGDQPVVLNQFPLSANDPAAEYLEGQKSLMAIPLYDGGESLNMVVITSEIPGNFREEDLPERVWMANLFGRATQNLVMAERLDEAYKAVDRELQVVADIQLSLLPRQMPTIPGLAVAAHYQTSRRAGGDYYDFFPLPNDCWGILIADVSGHGTPAAVMMAVTHCIAHTYPGRPTPPSELLSHLNHHLTSSYTQDSGHFVTAFYGIYNPAEKTLTYACAGHNPPRLRQCGHSEVLSLNRANTLPLGVTMDWQFRNEVQQLRTGDRLVLYTDGIIEATNRRGELFGTERLDKLIRHCSQNPEATLNDILESLQHYTEGLPAADDRTLLIVDLISP